MKKRFTKLLFSFLGLAALVWFLIRVIPKPGRASYPCIRASMPLASSFVLYVISLTSAILFFKKARKFLLRARYVLFTITLLLGISISFLTQVLNNQKANASYVPTEFLSANEVFGEGSGAFPGRVAWVYNPDATNEDCTNSENDGTPIKSLGVHEHWNNADDKLYSRNMGMNYGIELISEFLNSSANSIHAPSKSGIFIKQVYPNPFSTNTGIGYYLPEPAKVNVSIYNLNGQKIKTLVDMKQISGDHIQIWDATMDNGSIVPTGVYLITLNTQIGNQESTQTRRILCEGK